MSVNPTLRPNHQSWCECPLVDTWVDPGDVEVRGYPTDPDDDCGDETRGVERAPVVHRDSR